jgi:hypothetical protein
MILFPSWVKEKWVDYLAVRETLLNWSLVLNVLTLEGLKGDAFMVRGLRQKKLSVSLMDVNNVCMSR